MINKYSVEKMKEQRQILLRRNKAINEINNDYNNLTDDNKDNLRGNIKILFLSNPRLQLDDSNKKLIGSSLYPEINFINLSKIYSDDILSQVSFL